ncbi:GerMN domain-containing protein [Paenibacillus yanchengensis]|uniref:GerMN domain-containing protein n=1 Tax=Paenibacillus yanchengensis TaxID=2035833 RepID=A0ABW4YLF2_9BACL
MMKQSKWLRHAVLVMLLVLPVLLAGCGIFSKEGKAIDPPQVEMEEREELQQQPSEEQQRGNEAGKEGEAGANEQPTTGAVEENDQAKGNEQTTVYLKDQNGYVAPISIPVAIEEGVELGQRTLELMVDNGQYASLLPEDFRALIPQGTEVLQYRLDPQTNVAQVDFSESFANYNDQDERSILEAITWSLTSLPGVQGVELYHEGAKLAEMPMAGYPLDEPLTREMGINVELASGVSYTNSYPVTLYFSALTYYDEQYYVPVTRLIERADSAAEAAMEQLIVGPQNKKDLLAVLLPDMAVSSIAQQDGVLTVDLENTTFATDEKIPGEMMDAILLSLFENTNAQSVQVKLNGQSDIVDDRNKTYSEPVARPEQVNAIKL